MAYRFNSNNRLFYAAHTVGIGTGLYAANLMRPVSGVQSVSVDTTFDLEQVYQLGQLDIYSNIENIPSVECTIEKVLDGTPLIQHLASDAGGSNLISRYSNARTNIAINFMPDTVSFATGNTSSHQCFLSGMFISAINFNFPVDGNFTESVTFVGNNKYWNNNTQTFSSAGSVRLFQPYTGVAEASLQTAPPTGFVSRRQHLRLGAGSSASDLTVCYLPREIPGVNASGQVTLNYASGLAGTNFTTNGFSTHVQSIQVSVDMGRTELFELGKKGPYHRYMDFPVEVTTAIEIIDLQGDTVDAREEANNVRDQVIYLITADGVQIDLGSKNRLTSVSSSGGEAGGGNRTVTYNYSNFNFFTVTRTGTSESNFLAGFTDPGKGENPTPTPSPEKFDIA